MGYMNGDRVVEMNSGGGRGYAYDGIGELVLAGAVFGGRRGGLFGGDDCCDRYGKLDSIGEKIVAHDLSNKFDHAGDLIRDGHKETREKIGDLDKELCHLGHNLDKDAASIKDEIRWGNQRVLDKMFEIEDRRKDRELSNTYLEMALYKKGWFDGSGPVMVPHKPACHD